jgi:hypothetical protein
MNLNEFIKKSVQDTLEHELMGQDSLKSLCMRHERLPLLYDRITHEVDKASKKLEVSRDTVKHLTRDFTKIFINAAKTHKDHQLMTDCQVDALNAKERKKKEAEELWEEIIVDKSRVETLGGGVEAF